MRYKFHAVEKTCQQIGPDDWDAQVYVLDVAAHECVGDLFDRILSTLKIRYKPERWTITIAAESTGE